MTPSTSHSLRLVPVRASSAPSLLNGVNPQRLFESFNKPHYRRSRANALIKLKSISNPRAVITHMIQSKVISREVADTTSAAPSWSRVRFIRSIVEQPRDIWYPSIVEHRITSGDLLQIFCDSPDNDDNAWRQFIDGLKNYTGEYNVDLDFFIQLTKADFMFYALTLPISPRNKIHSNLAQSTKRITSNIV
ncbi:hypothetical protein DPV78_007507 [Talaromyces pinophilus]|nr:hypothetical protein DPV78_007507 [Talaromyces pinophilus]